MSCAFIAASVSRSTHRAAPGYTIPQIPHISEARFAGAETVRQCWLEFVPNALQQVFHHDDTLVRTEYLRILGGLDYLAAKYGFGRGENLFCTDLNERAVASDHPAAPVVAFTAPVKKFGVTGPRTK